MPASYRTPSTQFRAVSPNELGASSRHSAQRPLKHMEPSEAGGSTKTLVVVVTGVSGAGKSTAVHTLEDLGFFCVDNLPTPVFKETLEAFASAGVSRIALGVDVRVRGFLEQAADALAAVAVPGERELLVLYLDASDEALLRRFSSTRRPHPLSTGSEHSTPGRARRDPASSGSF